MSARVCELHAVKGCTRVAPPKRRKGHVVASSQRWKAPFRKPARTRRLAVLARVTLPPFRIAVPFLWGRPVRLRSKQFLALLGSGHLNLLHLVCVWRFWHYEMGQNNEAKYERLWVQSAVLQLHRVLDCYFWCAINESFASANATARKEGELTQLREFADFHGSVPLAHTPSQTWLLHTANVHFNSFAFMLKVRHHTK